MILVISQNDQIIGADEEFLQNTSFEDLKLNFPSMELFTLQTSGDSFEFTYNNQNYFVIKQKFYTETDENNIFIFKTKNKQIENTELSNEESPEIEIPINNELIEENNQKNDLDLNNIHDNNDDLNSILSFDNSPNEESAPSKSSDDLSLTLDSSSETNNNSLEELNLSFDNTPNEEPVPSKSSDDLSLTFDSSSETNNNSLEELNLSFDDTPSEEPTPSKSSDDLSLTFDSSSETNNNNDLEELNLSFDNTPNEAPAPSKSSDDLSLTFDSSSETNNNNALEELNLSFDNTPNEEPVSNYDELNLGLDSTTTSNNIEISITEDDIKQDLSQASSDLGIDSETLNQLFEDFKQQIKDEKNIFQQAISELDYDTLHKSAHKLKGVAFNLRLLKFGDLFKNIDDLAKSQADIKQIESVIQNIYSIIEDENEINTTNNIEKKINFINSVKNKEEKDIILKSIQISLEELKNENDETIKSNLKYLTNIIECDKLSNIDSSSKEELLNIIDFIIQSIKKEM